jgi:hypothetical protein
VAGNTLQNSLGPHSSLQNGIILLQAKAGVVDTQAARGHSSLVAGNTLQVWLSPHSSVQTGIILLQINPRCFFWTQVAVAQVNAVCGLILHSWFAAHGGQVGMTCGQMTGSLLFGTQVAVEHEVAVCGLILHSWFAAQGGQVGIT